MVRWEAINLQSWVKSDFLTGDAKASVYDGYTIHSARFLLSRIHNDFVYLSNSSRIIRLFIL
jgi:hypothetical protein